MGVENANDVQPKRHGLYLALKHILRGNQVAVVAGFVFAGIGDLQQNAHFAALAIVDAQ